MKAQDKYKFKSAIKKIRQENKMRGEKWGMKEMRIAQQMITPKAVNGGESSWREELQPKSLKNILNEMGLKK